MSKREIVIAIVMTVIFVMFSGCTKRPPEDVIVEMMKKYILEKRGIYCGGVVPDNIKIENIEYESYGIEYGKYNKAANYWPVRIKVVFTAECKKQIWRNEPYKSMGKVRRDETITMKVQLYEDDFGKKTWRRITWF